MTALVSWGVAQMPQPPEVWSFTATNLLTLVFGSVLTTIAYRAYRREQLKAFRSVTAGFALITLGTVVEMAYELVFNDILSGGISAFGRELFLLRTVEGVFIAAGFALLIYSFRLLPPPN